MNRAERRRQGKVNAKADKTWNINKKQLMQIKKAASDIAVEEAFTLMMAIPVMVIHDHYPKIMKREGRERTFLELCYDLYDTYSQGYVTLEELQDCIAKECGFSIIGDKLKRIQ